MPDDRITYMVLKRQDIQNDLLQLLHPRKGHFLTESGRHTNLWFEIDKLFINVDLIKPIVNVLGEKLMTHRFDIICGPMEGGARIAEMISKEFGVEYVYSERRVTFDKNDVKPLVSYSIPKFMRDRIEGKRIALVDDIINAGAAIKQTFEELIRLEAIPVVMGCLLVKGNLIYPFATGHNLPIEEITKLKNNMWIPQECPLCVSKQPIERVY